MVERMCIVTRVVRDEAELLRFVRAPDGAVVPDVLRKLPGRGVWVTLNRAMVADAAKRKLFAKGFAAETLVPGDLADMVGRVLRQNAVSLLSLARKAGAAVSGFMKVEEMVGRGRARLIIHSVEAQPDGCRKLDKLAAPGVGKITILTGDELDLAFGRANVVHAAVAKGGLAEKLANAVRRVELYEAPAGPKGREELV